MGAFAGIGLPAAKQSYHLRRRGTAATLPLLSVCVIRVLSPAHKGKVGLKSFFGERCRLPDVSEFLSPAIANQPFGLGKTKYNCWIFC